MTRISDGAAPAQAAVVSTTGNTTNVADPAQRSAQAEPAQRPAQELIRADVFHACHGQGILPGGCIPPRPFPLPQPLPFPRPLPLPFPLPEPRPFPLPEPRPLPLPPLPRCPVPRDASADAALKELDQKPAPISGEDMAKAIQKGTADLDNQAAGQEYRQFADWARRNQDKLSPEAKEVLKVYGQAAKAAQAKGQTGISHADYKKMLVDMKKAATTDVSAKKALDALSKGDGKISGEDMTRAIENGTKDLDNRSAGREFDQFAKWAEQNADRLSPEAKKVMEIYKKYADAARAKGQTGISPSEYQKMLAEMKEVKTYKDEGAGKVLDQLNHTSGPVNGQQMLDAIRNGTKDLDGQAAGNEMQDFIAWARDNASRLTPEAKKVLAIYMKYATQAVLQGQTGINPADYQKMLAEMKAALQPPPRPIAA